MEFNEEVLTNELEKQGNKQKEKGSKNRKEKDVMIERVKGSNGLLSKNEAAFIRGLQSINLMFLLFCYRQLLVVVLIPSGAPLRPGFHH